MSSFKKLRLDPETQSSLRNQPGASDHSSSFSSSTSGGNGTYGRTSGSGPFRTRYSQPSSVPSPHISFSRFSPYYFGKERRATLRVPLIRARRDESDSDGLRPSSRASLGSSIGGESVASATTTTAQRIIETLQNISTPVLNAGRLRIEPDIKAVQPLTFGLGSTLPRVSPGSSFNRSGGPPKMCSSLLLSNPSPSNQISPSHNAMVMGDHRRIFCIPKMVDAATNTEKEQEVSVSSPSQMHIANKMGMGTTDVTTGSPFGRPVAAGASSSRPAQAAPSTTGVASKEDNSDDEFHECSSEFTFSSAWAPEVFERYFSTEKEKEDKSVTGKGIGGTQTQPPLLNGYKDNAPVPVASTILSAKSPIRGVGTPTPPTTTPTTVTSSASTSTSSGFKPTGTGFNFGSTQSLDQSSKPGSGSTDDSKTKTFGSPVGTPAPAPMFKSTGTAPSDQGKSTFSFGKTGGTKDETFKSSSTMSTGVTAGFTGAGNWSSSLKPSTTTTSAEPAASKPDLPPLIAKKQEDKWRCPTCMVENDLSAVTCICCCEKNPKPAGVGASSSSAATVKSKWNCPTCMVSNEFTVPACVCCAEKNPNASVDKKETTPTAPTPTFKFGLTPTANQASTTATSSSTSAATGSFGFGKPIGSDTEKGPQSTSTFKFGAPPTTSAPLTSVSTASATAAPPTFQFGSTQPSTASQKFSFSASSGPTSAASVSSSSSVTTSSNIFGSSATTTSGGLFSSPVATTVSTAANTGIFGSSVSTTTAAASTSLFGSPAKTLAGSGNIFGAPKLGESQLDGGSSGPPASVFGGSSFQSASQPVTGGFSFGGTPATTVDSQKQASAAPSFSFGSAATNKSFSFGSSQPTPSGTPNVTPAPAAPPPISQSPVGALGAPNFSFGSANPPSASPFGSAAQSPNMFQFGGMGAAPPNPVSPQSTVPGFNMTPNLNFGTAVVTPGGSIPFGNPTQPTPSAGAQPPPPLFQFNAQPNPGESPGGRKIKKAVRRFNK